MDSRDADSEDCRISVGWEGVVVIGKMLEERSGMIDVHDVWKKMKRNRKTLRIVEVISASS